MSHSITRFVRHGLHLAVLLSYREPAPLLARPVGARGVA